MTGLAVLLAWTCCAGTDLPPVVDDVRRDVAWLASEPSRVVGSAGHDTVLARLETELRAIPGVQVWSQTFPVHVPCTEEAVLTVSEAGGPRDHRIYPLWPAGVRLNTTPGDGVTGSLHYLGKARFEDMPVCGIKGQIAVMEMTGGDSWRSLFALGVKAVLLLGSERETFLDAASHLLPVPVNFPRFYVPDGALAHQLRSLDGPGPRARVSCRARWGLVEARNTFALVLPSARDKPRKAIAVGVPVDSISVVPELAPGADGAVDVATALALVRRYADGRIKHPVLFTFLDACAIDHLGVRQMLMSFGSLPELRHSLREEDRETLELYRQHEALAAELDSVPDPTARLHESRYRALHDYVKQEVQKDVLTIDAQLEPLRLLRFKDSVADEERRRVAPEIERLQTQRTQYYLAQKQLIEPAAVTGSIRPMTRQLWQRARRRIQGQLAAAQSVLSADERCAALRRQLLSALGLRDTEEAPLRPISFFLGLDLSDAGIAVGPSLQDDFMDVNETRNATDFCRWLQVLASARASEVWPEALRRVVNLGPAMVADPQGQQRDEKVKLTGGVDEMREPWAPRSVNLLPLKGLESPASHRVTMTANVTAVAPSFGLPAMTWATLDGLRLRVDTPQDTAARLDWDRLSAQISATVALLDAWVRDADFAPVEKAPLPHVLRIRATVVDQAPGEPLARVPMEGYLAVLLPGREAYVSVLPPVPGVRRLQFERTGVDGRCVFSALPGESGWSRRLMSLQCYQLDDAGRIVRTVNKAKSSKGIRLDVDRRWRKSQPLRATVFSCDEFSAADLYDPRFLMPLPQVSVIDARRGTPKRINHALYDGMLSFFLEHGVRWQLLLRAGIVGNRMILVNALPAAESVGVSVRESLLGYRLGESFPDHPFLTSTRDFYRLDSRRLSDYRKAGIANKAIERMQQRTHEELTAAEAAYANDDGAAFFKHAMGGLGNEVRSYQAIRRTADDVIRGAIFLLLVLLPFAYATERLLFAATYVYRQIAGATGIFAVMTAVLWSFHPAFRMSSMPMMIVMAFGVIFMSLLVILVIFSKFENELEKMRSGKAESSSAKTSRFGLVSTAMRLGIANMRKRKLRTALTGVTVVLITFALLCFMSASAYMDKTEKTLDSKAMAPAVLVRQPGQRSLPHKALDFLQNMVGAEYEVIPRYWWCNSWDPQWRLHVRNPQTGRQVSLTAGLGVVGKESEVSGIDRVCPDWAQFAGGTGCYLSRQMAGELDVKPGETLVVAGRSLALLGLYDGARFDREVLRIDGKSLLPPDYSLMDDQERRMKSRSDLNTLMLEMASGALREEEEGGSAPVSSDQVIVLPAQLLVGMKHCSLRSMAIPAASADEARALATHLSRRLAFPIYYGSPEEVRVVAATPLSARAPKSLLIPLLIAGFIIFNTMLSSLAERKREIYIYTSLGLAPLHIGVLFLAEAVTYGLLGSIFGYIIGQGLATVFSALGWMGGLTLNFGGTQAVVTMLLVLAIVVLSSLVPAYLAGKVAAPSNQMRWAVPPPERDGEQYVIRDVLPFTATSTTAAGISAFLHEYFEAHLDGAIGHFTSADLRTFRSVSDGRVEVALAGTVWLAPYDLGVRQHLCVTMRELPVDEDLYELRLELRHGAGQLRTWHRLNRTFLGNLRRQLLGWRKLTSERVLAYIRQGEQSLGSA